MASEPELAGIRDRLFGLIDEHRIRRVAIPRPSAATIDALRGLTDLCSTVSDALDALGVGAAIAATDLPPRTPDARLVGPAVTIRYAHEGGTAGAHIARADPARLADRDAYAVGREGDVIVVDCGGVADASVMGGLSGRWARRLGMAGCVVDGAIRDVDSIARHGVPVWSRAVTPRTGKHRMAAIEINGCVSLAGATVEPGDLVVADTTGVCVVPSAAVERVSAMCLQAEAVERSVIAAVQAGKSPAEISRLHPPERW